jgi:HK97 family phage major capsid protein
MKIIDDIFEYLRTGQNRYIRSINSQGGALLPIGIAQKIHEAMAAIWPLLSLVSWETVSHLKIKVPYKKSDIQVNWLDEGETYSEAELGLGGFMAKLKKYGALVKVSEEVIADSVFNLEEFIINSFGRGQGEEFEKVFINGDGVGKPRGFLLDCENIPATGAAITYDDIKEVFSGLKESYFGNAVWLVNKNAFLALLELADENDNRILIPRSGGEDVDGFLLGKPCYITMLPENKPVSFGDFSNYQVIEHLPIIQRLGEAYSEDGLIGFILKGFMDAKLLKDDAVITLEMQP